MVPHDLEPFSGSLPTLEVEEVAGELRRQAERHVPGAELALVEDDGQVRAVNLRVVLAKCRTPNFFPARLLNCNIEGARLETEGRFPVGSRVLVSCVEVATDAELFRNEFVVRNRVKIEVADETGTAAEAAYLFGSTRGSRFETPTRLLHSYGLECRRADGGGAPNELYRLLLHSRYLGALH